MRQAKRQKKQLILIGKLKEIIKTDGCNYAVIPIRVILNGEKIGSCNAEIILGLQCPVLATAMPAVQSI